MHFEIVHHYHDDEYDADGDDVVAFVVVADVDDDNDFGDLCNVPVSWISNRLEIKSKFLKLLKILI